MSADIERGSLHHPTNGRVIEYLAVKSGTTCRWYFVDSGPGIALEGAIYGVVTFCNDREGNPEDFLRRVDSCNYVELWANHFRIVRILNSK